MKLARTTLVPTTPISFAATLGALLVLSACRDIWNIGNLPAQVENSGGSTTTSGGAPNTCEPRCELTDSSILRGVRCSAQNVASRHDCDADSQCDPRNGACIKLAMDEHEVTEAEFQAFVDAAAEQPDLLSKLRAPTCDAVTSEQLGQGGAGTECVPECREDCDDYPKVCVSWCEASMYCRYRGQFLCGSLNGAMVGAQDRFQDDPVSEGDESDDAWFNGCSVAMTNGGGVSSSCMVVDDDGPTTIPADTQSNSCSEKTDTFAGYAKFKGLHGNVSEWTNDCLDGGGVCSTRGSSYSRSARTCESKDYKSISDRGSDVGFRCCGEPN